MRLLLVLVACNGAPLPIDAPEPPASQPAIIRCSPDDEVAGASFKDPFCYRYDWCLCNGPEDCDDGPCRFDEETGPLCGMSDGYPIVCHSSADCPAGQRCLHGDPW